MTTLHQLTQLHHFLSKPHKSRSSLNRNVSSLELSRSHSFSYKPRMPHLCLKPQWPEEMDWRGCGLFEEEGNCRMSDGDDELDEDEETENYPLRKHRRDESSTSAADIHHGQPGDEDHDEDSNEDSDDRAGIEKETRDGPETDSEESDTESDMPSAHQRKRTSYPEFQSKVMGLGGDSMVVVTRRCEPNTDEMEDLPGMESCEEVDDCMILEDSTLGNVIEDRDDMDCSDDGSISTAACPVHNLEDRGEQVAGPEELMITSCSESNGMPAAKRCKLPNNLDEDEDEVPGLTFEYDSEGDFVVDEEDTLHTLPKKPSKNPTPASSNPTPSIGDGSKSAHFRVFSSYNTLSKTKNSISPRRVLTIWKWVSPIPQMPGGYQIADLDQQNSRGRKAKVVDVENNSNENGEYDRSWNRCSHCVRCNRLDPVGMRCVCRSQQAMDSNSKGESFGDSSVVFVSREWDSEADDEDECIEIQEDLDSCTPPRDVEENPGDRRPPSDYDEDDFELWPRSTIPHSLGPSRDSVEEQNGQASSSSDSRGKGVSAKNPFTAASSLSRSPSTSDSDSESKEDTYVHSDGEEVEDEIEGDKEEKGLPIRILHARKTPGIWIESAELSRVRAEDWMEAVNVLRL